MPQSPASPSEHYYLSTACLHQFHDYCAAPVARTDGYATRSGEPKTPAVCKFCQARCICPCHRGEPIPPLGHTGDY